MIRPSRLRRTGDDERPDLRTIGAISAAAVAALSVLYAVAYLGMTPADQRGANADAFFRSYLAHPAGLRVASVCLLVSGPLVGLAVVALTARLRPTGEPPARFGGLGLVLGADMVALFVASAAAVNAVVLVTGGLASVVLGPAWWRGVARMLTARPDDREAVTPAPPEVGRALQPQIGAPV